jgi:hypothetical protein
MLRVAQRRRERNLEVSLEDEDGGVDDRDRSKLLVVRL